MMNIDVIAPTTQGGAQSKRVTVGLYPMVAAMVGKNISYVTPISTKAPAMASHHIFQSVRASTRPTRCALFFPTFPRSSSILFTANICSSAVSHEAGAVGKSGIIWNDAIPMMHVKLPSIKKSHLIPLGQRIKLTVTRPPSITSKLQHQISRPLSQTPQMRRAPQETGQGMNHTSSMPALNRFHHVCTFSTRHHEQTHKGPKMNVYHLEIRSKIPG